MIETIRNGVVPTFETRRESYDSVDTNKRREQVLLILEEATSPLTAKEIAVIMKQRGYTNSDDRNSASPRLTELMKIGKVEAIKEKRKCQYTGKMVAQFVLREQNKKGE